MGSPLPRIEYHVVGPFQNQGNRAAASLYDQLIKLARKVGIALITAATERNIPLGFGHTGDGFACLQHLENRNGGHRNKDNAQDYLFQVIQDTL